MRLTVGKLGGGVAMTSEIQSVGFTNRKAGLWTGVLVIGVLALSLLAGTVWGQVTASIPGTVKDVSGAVLPETAVTVKHLETGLTRTAQTDSSGGYSVPSLPV